MNKIVYVGKHALTMSVSRHMHNSWELIYCTSGEGTMSFDDRVLPYKTHDIMVIPPFVPHSNKSAQGFTNIHINIAEPTLTFTEPLLIPADANGFLLSAFNAAYYYYSGSAADTLFLPLYSQLIIAYLSAYQPSQPQSAIVQEIESCILNNFQDCAFDLNAYLHTLPFSPDYLKKLFKKETGLTPLQYLTDRRLENAAYILSTYYGKGNISETAHLCGFSDPLYFSRLFKKRFGVSPRNYIGEADETLPDERSIKMML